MASASGADIPWSDIAVKTAVQAEAAAAREGVANGEDLAATLASVGGLLKAAGRDDEFTAVREAAARLLQARHDLHVHQAALSRLGAAYRPTGEATDFAAELAAAAAEVEAAQPYDVEGDELLRGFDAAAGGAAADERIDDEIAIAGESARPVARNTVCPITMKPLVELEEPVEDAFSFVYERSAIELMLANKRGGVMPCPVAGTTHTVTAAELKPARAVLAEKRRGGGRRRGGAPQEDADLVELD